MYFTFNWAYEAGDHQLDRHQMAKSNQRRMLSSPKSRLASETRHDAAPYTDTGSQSAASQTVKPRDRSRKQNRSKEPNTEV